MDEHLGMIKLFAGSFEPKGWMACKGQSLPISQYTNLYNTIGTTFGGGKNSFCLPNLQGSVPMGAGMRSSESEFGYVLGEVGGTNSVTLQSNNIPAHTHQVEVSVNFFTNNESSDTPEPSNAYEGPADANAYSTEPTDGVFMGPLKMKYFVHPNPYTTTPFSNTMPFVGMMYIIYTGKPS